MQTVTIGQLFTQWTSETKSHESPIDIGAVLYRISDGSIVLYIGISLRNIDVRLREHLGLAYHAQSPIGRLIERMLPESVDWAINLFTTDELRTYLRPQWKHRGIDQWSRQDVARVAETEMIQRDRPCLNDHNNVNPRSLPKRYRDALSGR
jgi:hypothetical protein